MPTHDNLQAAFAGESQANRKYLAFAAKADAEGHPQIAKLFRAAAAAETVHAHAHLRVMGGVKDTKQNLQAAIDGERHEFKDMYPNFIQAAEAEGNRAAVISFRNANAVEEIHHGLYAEALETLEAGKDLPPAVIHVCEVCGNTVVGEAPEQLPGLRGIEVEVQGSGVTMIRPCTDADFDTIYSIINEAAEAYRGVIPADRWHEPYMPRDQLRHEIESGVRFWGYEECGQLLGVMGIQDVQDVTLIRHAYVRTANHGQGIGGKLLAELRKKAARPILIGTWAAATWAIRFYEKHGFRMVTPEEKNRLLKKYWSIPERQVETSVVLAEAGTYASSSSSRN